MSNPQKPCRQRRLSRVYESEPAYFVTLCVDERKQVLDNQPVFKRTKDFCAESMERYGIFVHSYILMPEHVHLIICIGAGSETTLGQWVKAFKAMVARHEFKWQPGFFDHVLRSDQSRTEKWEYVRYNPVRAGLVEDADAWPYSQSFSRLDGEEL